MHLVHMDLHQQSKLLEAGNGSQNESLLMCLAPLDLTLPSIFRSNPSPRTSGKASSDNVSQCFFSPDRISQIPFSTNKGLSPTVTVGAVVRISANISLSTKGFKQTKELHVCILYLDADCTLHHAWRNCKPPCSTKTQHNCPFSLKIERIRRSHTLWVVHLLFGFVDFVVHFDI